MIPLLTLLALSSTLFAQSPLLQEVDSLFRAGEYERVELLVLRAERQPELDTGDQVTLQLLGGYSMIMLERVDDAKAHFVAALEIDSSLTLDPVTVSPKFRVVFDDVRRQWRADHLSKPPAEITREVSTYRSARRESHLVNLLIPGTGFLREGKTLRGALHLAAQVAVTALWLSS
ncbi:MAG: hypothetical protein IPG71_05045 [bacterium]|nr:hypothetical protein [bacterium]